MQLLSECDGCSLITLGVQPEDELGQVKRRIVGLAQLPTFPADTVRCAVSSSDSVPWLLLLFQVFKTCTIW